MNEKSRAVLLGLGATIGSLWVLVNVKESFTAGLVYVVFFGVIFLYYKFGGVLIRS